MAQSLILFVAHRDARGEEDYLSLGEWISTIAKPMSTEGIFSYADDYRSFNPIECLNKVRGYVESHYGKMIEANQKEREDCLDAIGRVSDSDLLSDLMMHLYDNRKNLEELESERKYWNHLISVLELCGDILESNEAPKFYYLNN